MTEIKNRHLPEQGKINKNRRIFLTERRVLFLAERKRLHGKSDCGTS